MLAILAFAFTASAASNEVDIEVGWLGTSDPSWGYFSDGETLASYGLRLGYAVNPHVAVLAGWQHSAYGGGIIVPAVGSGASSDGEYTYYDSQDAFFAAMYADQITVGAKADVTVAKWLHPYAAVNLVGLRGLVRMDDDQTDDENVTQIEVAGLTGGVSGALGFEIPVPVKVDGKVAIAPYLEMGYGWLAPMKLQDLGSVQFAGFTGRAGVGVRF